MNSFLRTFVAVTLTFSALICWLGDFNQYTFIDGKEFVDWTPSTEKRWGYAFGIASPVAFILSFAFIALEHTRSSRFGHEFLILWALAVTFLYFFGDLNMYVVGYGPYGRDWVKDRPESGERVLFSVLLGGLWSVLSASVLTLIRVVTTKRDVAAEHVDVTGRRT